MSHASLQAPFEIMFGRKAVIPIELTYLDPGSHLLINYSMSSERVVPLMSQGIFYALKTYIHFGL